MSERGENIATEIASIERKSDQSCSIHAFLRDRYQTYASILDYFLVAATTYLLGLSLVEPAIGLPLSFGFDRPLLITLFSLVVFFLSVIQFKNDWKSLAAAHQRSFKEYAEVKSACRTLTSSVRKINSTEHQRIVDRYKMVTEVGTHIPDKTFVIGKAHHARKVFVSQYLDKHPGARPAILHLKLFLRDNLNINLLSEDDVKKN